MNKVKKILKSEQRSHGTCLNFHTWQNSPHGENLSGQRGQKLNRFMIAFHERRLFNKIVTYVVMGSEVVQKKTHKTLKCCKHLILSIIYAQFYPIS